MRAVVYDRYGPPDVLRLVEVERPSPAPGEILVRVRATTINRFDCATRAANRQSGIAVSMLSRLISGVRAPRRQILGSEVAGEVAEVGAEVTAFAPGDRVFANTGLRFGCHAEFACVRATGLVAHVPAGMTYEEAAPATDGALNALWSLRQGGLRERERILVYGASGAIGSAGVQLAAHFGADVTAVCGTKNLELMAKLGAQRALDYTREDFTRAGESYDVIFDAVGKLSFMRCRSVLRLDGRYLATDGLGNLLLAVWTSRIGGRRVVFSIPPRHTQQDVLLLKQLMEAGVYRPVLDRRQPLEEVIEATRYVETEQKTGNVVLTVAGG